MCYAITITPTGNGKLKATVGNNSMEFADYATAARWGDAVRYGYQPDKCIFDGGYCGYPIDDCKNCPCHPDSSDPYWGMTKAVIGGG